MVLLLVALLFFDLGVPFVAAATVEIALGRDRWRRAFVVAVPTVLWLLWYVAWGHNAHTFISFRNFANAPSYVLDGLSATSLATLVGLGVPLGRLPDESARLGPAAPGPRPGRGRAGGSTACARPPRLLALLVLLLGFWALTALNATRWPRRRPAATSTSASSCWSSWPRSCCGACRIGRWAIAGVLAVSVAAAASPTATGCGTRPTGSQGIAQQERGGLAALELTRGRVSPGFELTQQNSGVDYLGFLDAGSYFSAIDAYGSPAYTPAELATAPRPARVSADKVFAAALGSSPGAERRPRRRCAARSTHSRLG